MRRIACLYDIHGNLPALEAVLAEVKTERVDAIAVGGDVVPGPMCQECFDLLFSSGIPLICIRGNCESDVLLIVDGKVDELHESVRETFTWVAEHLSESTIGQIRSWPISATAQVERLGTVLFCHGSPRHENEIFTERTDEEKLKPIMDAANADVVVCGHTHIQFDRNVGRTRVINAGSLGTPNAGRTGSDWLILGPDAELRHTDYDIEAAAERMGKTQYPGKEKFIEKYVRNAPPAEEMLALCATAELRGK